MNVINWQHLELSRAELEKTSQAISSVISLRALLRTLVVAILDDYPWNDRNDLVPVFDSSQEYRPEDIVAFPQHDDQELRPDTWQIGRVTATAEGYNPAQGVFQVVIVALNGNEQAYAAGLSDGQPLPLQFPPQDPEDLEWLISYIVDTWYQSLIESVRQAIEDGRLDAVLMGDQVLPGNALLVFDEAEQRLIAEAFADLPADGVPYLTTDDLLLYLWEANRLSGVPEEPVRFSLNLYLREHPDDYQPFGNQRWISVDRLEGLDRQVARRPQVPVVQSKVAQELDEDDTPDFTDYEELELTTEEEATLEELGESLETEPETDRRHDWQPPSEPIALPPLTYQHIIEAFFPLHQRVAKAFPPDEDLFLVDVRVIDGEPIPCLVSREEKMIKALDRNAFRQQFLMDRPTPIPAGTRLWLEYQGESGGNPTYRVAPRPLPKPRTVQCKLAWVEGGEFQFAETQFDMHYQGDPHLFRAELRFEDIAALFQEAEESGLSIFDALWYVFHDFTEDDPDVRLHHTELFNAVFFKHRMCSPRSVVAELYDRPCFMSVGDGYFKFEPERGIQRQSTRRRLEQCETPPQPPAVVVPPQRERPAPEPSTTAPEPGYFILQQRSSEESEYADQVGEVYKWRQGIPGSNQIEEGAHFIYYRPGERVFFGSGRVDNIEEYEGDDGQTYYDGHMADYEPWEPALPLTRELAEDISFIEPDWIGIGQAGIRKITQEDFETILGAYREMQSGTKPEPAKRPEVAVRPAVKVPDIGIRNVIYPIPFASGEIPEKLTKEPLWRELFGGRQLALGRGTPTSEEIDEVLMQLIADKKANRFVTPREVVDFMVNLAQPKPGERVADICCGTGIFLLKALRFVKEIYGEDADLELYGADEYSKAVKAARLNLLANDVHDATLVGADSLQTQDGMLNEKYDLILGNPPFGRGQAQAFLRRWAELLRDRGRMVVNISEGTLTNSSHTAKEVRTWLVENFEIEIVTSLPRPSDFDRYGAKSNIAYLRKVRPEYRHATVLSELSNLEEASRLLDLLNGR